MTAALELPALGSGIGFREVFRGNLFLNQERVDFLEITADHYLDIPIEKRDELRLLADHFTLIPHGLNLSLGSAEGLDYRYLEKLAALVEMLRPPWWSEHIAFTRAGGLDIGHLTPLPFTQEAIDVLCRNIAQVKQRLPGFPLILENITYSVVLPGAEMTETEFLSRLLERSDCGLLLDVTNLFINAQTHGYDPHTFLDRIPSERIVQLHFAGGHQHEDQWIDSHAHSTPEPVWALLDEILERFPVKGVILERDENIPPFAELVTEVSRARELGQRHGRWV